MTGFSAALLGANPSHGRVTFGYALPERARVRVEVFSVAGQRVRTLLDDVREAGMHREAFAIRGDGGGALDPGVYRLRISAGAQARSLRVVAFE